MNHGLSKVLLGSLVVGAAFAAGAATPPDDKCTLMYTLENIDYWSWSCSGTCPTGSCTLRVSVDPSGSTRWCECGSSPVSTALCRAKVRVGPAPYHQPITVTCETLSCAYGCVNNTSPPGSGPSAACRCPG